MKTMAIILQIQSLSINDFIAILTLIFSIYVLMQSIIQVGVNKKSNRFLVMLMAQLVVISAMSFITDNLVFIARYVLFLYIPTFLFISPTIYLYIKSLTESSFQFDKKAKMHFALPFFIMLTFLIINIILNLSLNFKISKKIIFIISDTFLYMNAFAIYVIPITQLIYYGIKIIRKYRSHLNNIKDYFSNTEEAQMSWVKYFIITYFTFMILFLFITIDIESLKNFSDSLYYGELLLLIIFVGFFGTKQADIYQKSLKNNQNKADEVIEQYESTSNQQPEETILLNQNYPSTSGLSETKKTEIRETLIELLEVEKMYLHPSLNINDLAEKLNTNQKYLSVVINDCFNKNFLTFINEYRINEAKSIITSDTNQKYSIEGIGNMSGFNSRSAFFNAFKKTTGMTPSAFKETLNN